MQTSFLKHIKHVGAALSLFYAFSANASVLNFDFDNLTGCTVTHGNNNCETISVANGDYFINVSAIAGTGSDLSTYNNADIEVWSFGGQYSLGVVDGPGGRRLASDASTSEYLIFEFGSTLSDPAQFKGVDIDFFGRWSSAFQLDEEAILHAFLDDTLVSTQTFTSQSGNDTASYIFPDYANTLYLTSGNGNGFRVENLAVDVPEPAPLALLGLGLAGLAFSRRKAAKP